VSPKQSKKSLRKNSRSLFCKKRSKKTSGAADQRSARQTSGQIAPSAGRGFTDKSISDGGVAGSPHRLTGRFWITAMRLQCFAFAPYGFDISLEESWPDN